MTLSKDSAALVSYSNGISASNSVSFRKRLSQASRIRGCRIPSRIFRAAASPNTNTRNRSRASLPLESKTALPKADLISSCTPKSASVNLRASMSALKKSTGKSRPSRLCSARLTVVLPVAIPPVIPIAGMAAGVYTSKGNNFYAPIPSRPPTPAPLRPDGSRSICRKDWSGK
jgi:hypothetical protein